MKIPLLVRTLALLVGASQAQESALLPCASWRAADATREPTTLLGETQRRQLIDGVLEHVQRLHVDPDFDGVDLDELRQTYATRIEAARSDHEVIALVEEMLAWVDAYYTSQEELQEQLAQAAFTGVGIQMSILSDGHVLGINYVYAGSPAEAAGLARGDRIIGVDQHSACPRPNHILGPAGTDVILTVTSPGQAPRRITITRASIEPIAPPRAMRLDEPGIGYLWPGLHLVERSARESVFINPQPERLDGVALVILVDAGSDGFTGMFAAALQWRQRAQVVGQPVQSAWRLYRSERLQDGSQVGVPVGEIALLDGTRLRQSGLIPDSVMTMDWRDHPKGDDPYVAEAIRLIRIGGIGTDCGPCARGPQDQRTSRDEEDDDRAVVRSRIVGEQRGREPGIAGDDREHTGPTVEDQPPPRQPPDDRRISARSVSLNASAAYRSFQTDPCPPPSGSRPPSASWTRCLGREGAP